ncbi:hypothetical protein GCM10023115_10600 [Pontixanthobacter gangjinensis]|uniref:Uncharacterized protein n=1 Tax=Pontixanthobacter gangjinensis TaxID=1028742 RepID=A0A6I4SMC4_9SPHN|nr:hypothetical protein [Pontixanthobacter gangjinensis]MXO56306.1 hypothetical protein [Pontixanthobacter gangjinensis]
MTDSSFASLSPTLLARKGGAKPAMRPQAAILTGGAGANAAAAHNLEDLGWNDMGDAEEPRHDAEILQLTPAPANPEAEAEARHNDEEAQALLADIPAKRPVVLEQQDKIAEHVAVQSQPKLAEQIAQPKAQIRTPRKRRSALERGKRAAFTLRLDAERHLKLRLACTLRNRSAQQIVTDALDQMLGSMPDVKSLAAQARNSE